MKWFLAAFKKYVDFNGRARRKEYWMFVLFSYIFIIAGVLIDNLLGLTMVSGLYGPFYIISGLLLALPGLAVTVRRLHDVGKSGAMIFIGLIPIVGAIWLLVLYCTDSEDEENKYGPNPKKETEDGTLLYA